MKSCPACKTQYSDDTLQFCLQDGTRLIWPETPGTPTVVLGEAETIVARGGPEPGTIPVNDPNSVAWQQSQVTHAASLTPEKKGSRTAIALMLTALGLLVLFGIVALAVLVFWRNSQQVLVDNANSNVNLRGGTANSNDNAVPTPKYTPYATTTSTRTTSTPGSTPTGVPISTPFPVPPVLKSYPSTTRLKFTRGNYSTSFAGDLNPSASRSLVLACRSGQSLSANISSGGGCVTMRGGGTSMRIMTSSGDNYLTITNSCSSVVHFSVSITVI